MLVPKMDGGTGQSRCDSMGMTTLVWESKLSKGEMALLTASTPGVSPESCLTVHSVVREQDDNVRRDCGVNLISKL